MYICINYFSFQVTLSAKLREGQLSVEQQKMLIGSLTQLKDPPVLTCDWCRAG